MHACPSRSTISSVGAAKEQRQEQHQGQCQHQKDDISTVECLGDPQIILVAAMETASFRKCHSAVARCELPSGTSPLKSLEFSLLFASLRSGVTCVARLTKWSQQLLGALRALQRKKIIWTSHHSPPKALRFAAFFLTRMGEKDGNLSARGPELYCVLKGYRCCFVV